MNINTSYLLKNHLIHLDKEDEQFIQASLKTRFDLGIIQSNLGKIIPRNDVIEGAYEQKIRGDGSCWARALWQDVFNQILNDSENFDAFILKVVSSRKLRCASTPHIANLIEFTISILYSLKDLHSEYRKDFLNHKEVDKVLIFYMRYIVAAQIEEEQKKGYYQEVTLIELEEIRNNMNKYGSGVEISAFASYFHIDTHTIFSKDTLKKSGFKNKFFYSEQLADSRINSLAIQVSKLKNPNQIVARFSTLSSSEHFDILIIPPYSEEKCKIKLQKKEEKRQMIEQQNTQQFNNYPSYQLPNFVNTDDQNSTVEEIE